MNKEEFNKYRLEAQSYIEWLIELLEETNDEIIKKEIRFQLKEHLNLIQPKLILDYKAERDLGFIPREKL